MLPDADDEKRLRQLQVRKRKTDHWDYMWPQSRGPAVAVLRKTRYDLYDARTRQPLPPPHHKTYSIQSRSLAQALLTPNSGWFWTIEPEWQGRLIYNLPAVQEALRFMEPVWITEGERDADTLTDLGVTATCHYQGAAGPTEDQAALLSAATEINILIDRDTTGILIGAKWANLLGHHKRVRFYWPADGHKDITEHVSAGLTLGDLGSTSARKLLARAEQLRGKPHSGGHYGYGGRHWVPEDDFLRHRQLAGWTVRYAPDRSEVELARRIEQRWGALERHDLDNCPTRIVMLARDRFTRRLSVEKISAPCNRWGCSKCYPIKIKRLKAEIHHNTEDVVSWVWAPAKGRPSPEAIRKRVRDTGRPYRTISSERGHLIILAGAAVAGRGWEMTECPARDFTRKLPDLLEPIEITRLNRGNGWVCSGETKLDKRYDALARQYIPSDRYASERLAQVGLSSGTVLEEGMDEDEARMLFEEAFQRRPAAEWSA